MKLSEAIRLGAMLKKQVVGSDGTHGSCALRAATDALGLHDSVRSGLLDYSGLIERFSELLQHVHCPGCAALEDQLIVTIFHLNDSHRWTREKIADFVETVERSLEDAAVGREDKRVASEIGSLTRA